MGFTVIFTPACLSACLLSSKMVLYNLHKMGVDVILTRVSFLSPLFLSVMITYLHG